MPVSNFSFFYRCGAILGKPTGGKMKMTPGVAFKIKK